MKFKKLAKILSIISNIIIFTGTILFIIGIIGTKNNYNTNSILIISVIFMVLGISLLILSNPKSKNTMSDKNENIDKKLIKWMIIKGLIITIFFIIIGFLGLKIY